MPIIEINELYPLLCDGIITSFTVDTSIFVSQKFKFNIPPLKFILSNFTNLNFVISDFGYKEIVKKYKEFILNEQDNIKNKLREGEMIKCYSAALKLIEDSDIEAECYNSINDFFSNRDEYIFSSKEYCDIEQITNLYFNSLPPFGKKNKKAEFPDAIILTSLENNAEVCEKSILLISRDKDWVEYCKTSLRLYIVDPKKCDNLLSDCINEFMKLNEFIYKLSQNIKNFVINSQSIKDDITESIKEYLDNTSIIHPIYDTHYHCEDEVLNIELERILYDNIDINIEFIMDGISCIYITIPSIVSCEAAFSIYNWDSEDKDYVYLDTRYRTVEKEINIYLDINSNIHELNPVTFDALKDYSIIEENYDINFYEI